MVFIHYIYPKVLYNSSKRVLGCIPCPKYRVIHRSLLFEAIQEPKQEFLIEILNLLKAREEKMLDTGESEDADVEKVSEILMILGKLEEVHTEHSTSLEKANQAIETPSVKKARTLTKRLSFF